MNSGATFSRTTTARKSQQSYIAEVKKVGQLTGWECEGEGEGGWVRVGGNGLGQEANQFKGPTGLSFDGRGISMSSTAE